MSFPQSSVLSAQSVLLATLLAFCSEILLWTSPPARSLLDWLLLALGYLALSALLLETAARFRLRDIFGLLTLAGIYGLLNGLLLNPQSALIDIPRTLITRAMGAHAFAGLLALALFFGLLGGSLRSRRLGVTLVLALLIGVGWGAWARWSPPTFSTGSETAPETLLLYTAIGVALIAFALILVRRATAPSVVPPSSSFRLDPRGWAFTLIVLFGLLIVHLLRGEIDPLSLVIIPTLAIFSAAILWFQQRKKGTTLLDALNAPTPDLVSLTLIVVAFAIGGALGFTLPRGESSSDPLALIGALFTAYGLVWLPAVSLVLGARAFSRQARAMRL